MMDSPTLTQTLQQVEPAADRRSGWLVAGGLIGAFLASACCVVPLALVLLGVSGAWIGNLTALEPYKPITSVIAIGLIGLGFWRVYFRRGQVCADGSYCARPKSSIVTKSALWFATALAVLAITIGWWAPLFY
jgi:mercuric ion transport protein